MTTATTPRPLRAVEPVSVSIAEALRLAAGPAAELAALIDTAGTEDRLGELRLAICGHCDVQALARRFAAGRSALRVAALRAARNRAPADLVQEAS